ncbi:MAG: UbiA family prenyltransferase [Raineya sp.]|jgi:1,4-dihydroxy-2-naphthoate octaprenyltransferase|nr:UbiA family prenyltransferase [Raineya sp.]
MQKSTLLHLRIPFSIFLMPVFLFAFSQALTIDWVKTIIGFISIHLFLYPASNGFNSYFDKDKESIGGLENPPPVSKELYWVSLCFDGMAIILGFFVSWLFALSLLIYGLVSKAYSHPSIRLKKYPFLSWFTIGIFQGFFTYLMSTLAINDFSFSELWGMHIIVPAILAMLLLMGSYPMTQVYQHYEDAQRGDKTLSLLLGIKGTFLLTAFAFFIANLGFIGYFYALHSNTSILIFEVALSPVLVYFGNWFLKVLKDKSQANFKNTMLLNQISSICTSTAFILIRIFA